ncbi:hypothetical protein [Sphingopyxis sp. BSNA05]|nr:hypothetical protein [Sphingopyxis sp. BSNA05]
MMAILQQGQGLIGLTLILLFVWLLSETGRPGRAGNGSAGRCCCNLPSRW